MADNRDKEWKVYFDGAFSGPRGRESAGKEILLDKQFVYNNRTWYIPALYLCSKGLVMDFCIRVPAEHVRAFMDKWKLSAETENEEACCTDEQQMRIEAEHPLLVNANPQAVVNGIALSRAHGCSVSWNPCAPESSGNGLVAERVMGHYRLDPAYGWVIWRYAFPWMEERKPRIARLGILLKQKPVAVPGAHFRAATLGKRIAFTHPISGTRHILAVWEYEREEIVHNRFGSPDAEVPTYCIVMRYTLSPDLPDDAFDIVDCARSDQPRQGHANPGEAQAFAVAVLGSTDGIGVGAVGSKLRTTCSALHFEPTDDVEWRMVFYEKTCEDITEDLI